MSVEKGWDEWRLGVKCQSNAEIAGSPRNRLRASLHESERAGYSSVNGRGPCGITACSQTTKSPDRIRESDAGG